MLFRSTVTHTYKYPGVYTVHLSAWTDLGKIFTEYATVNVDYVYRDAVVFSVLPELYNLPGTINPDPFVVSITSSNNVFDFFLKKPNIIFPFKCCNFLEF